VQQLLRDVCHRRFLPALSARAQPASTRAGSPATGIQFRPSVYTTGWAGLTPHDARRSQIRRYVYHDVVKLDDVEPLLLCEGVQVSPSAREIFRHEVIISGGGATSKRKTTRLRP
jgi:hypothetical protein